MILAPYTVKEPRMLNKVDENGNVVLDASGKILQEEHEVNVTRFKTTTVFDISQTSGEPIPSLVHDLQGYYSPTSDKIVVNSDLEDLQIAKTLIHEYAHSLLHKQTDKSHSQREIEAESLAFVLCDHFGIDTSEYSFGYIASYANRDFEELKAILLNIQSNAHEMIEHLEPIFKEKMQMIENENKYITPVEMEQLNHDLVNQIVPILKNIETIELTSVMETKITEFLNSNPDFNTQAILFEKNDLYHHTLQMACLDAMNDPDFYNNQKWFVNRSIEHHNYELFEKFAKPLLTDTAYYMKYTTLGFMDLNVEVIDENRIAIAHNFELNGDLMADPDIEFTVDKENRLLYPQTYQQDTLQRYEVVNGDAHLASDLNVFMNQWMHNIMEQGYKVDRVYTQDKELSKPSELHKFCKENDIKQMAPKVKEIER